MVVQRGSVLQWADHWEEDAAGALAAMGCALSGQVHRQGCVLKAGSSKHRAFAGNYEGAAVGRRSVTPNTCETLQLLGIICPHASCRHSLQHLSNI